MDVEDYLHLEPAPADRRLAYGSDPEQFGDLYLPRRAGPRPVAIVLHGGCWRSAYGLEPAGGLCAALAAEGVAVWSLEYRRLGSGGGWPATFRDVGSGADFLREIAGAHALDLSRVIAIGHSAGGHLATWLAARHRLPAGSEIASSDPLPLLGVVPLAGITDLAEGARLGLCGGACRELVGGTTGEAEGRYRQASPSELLPLGVPQRHLVGSEDDLVPAAYVRACVEAASRHGEAKLEVISGVGHFELVVPRGPAWAALRAAALELLGPAGPGADSA